jgi:glyceraldehyde-3-phosphate dehydrogenase (NADP+)
MENEKKVGEIKDFPRNLWDIPEEFRMEYLYSSQYLDGDLKTHNGGFQKVYSPIMDKSLIPQDNNLNCIGQYPLMTVAQAESVLETAVKAWDFGMGEWPKMSWQKRIDHVELFVNLMKNQRNKVVKLLMWEIGKSSKDSFKEFDRTIEYIEKTIVEYRLLNEGTDDFRETGGLLTRVPRTPLGVTLCMGPFNYPLNETLTIIIPALIMGNVVIYKPAKYGVLLMEPLLECFAESFPRGVVGTVYGDGQTVITPLMQSGKIDCFAFIGMSNTADKIVKNHPNPHRLRMILGLEAKNPAVIFPNVDIDLAVRECITGSLSFNGQRCTAIKIIFVHRSKAEEFVKKFSDAVDALPLGMPWDDQNFENGPMQTPMPEVGKMQWMRDYISDACLKRAKTINLRAGQSFHTMMIPAVLYPCNPSMRIYHEEQFGPVVPIVPYDDFSEIIEYMEKSPYGQQISLFTKDNIDYLIMQLANQVCRVNINMQCQRGPDILPFTGRKNSAMGTLSIYDALRSFSIRTVIAGYFLGT